MVSESDFAARRESYTRGTPAGCTPTPKGLCHVIPRRMSTLKFGVGFFQAVGELKQRSQVHFNSKPLLEQITTRRLHLFNGL